MKIILANPRGFFNVADIAICIGAGLLALDAFKGDKKSGQK